MSGCGSGRTAAIPMRRWPRRLLGAIVALPLLATAAPAGLEPSPQAPAAAGWQQRLGARLPDGLPVVDEAGTTGHPQTWADGRPWVLAPVYYGCPKLCSVTLDGLAGVADVLAARHVRVLAVSIRAEETPADAARAAHRLRARHPDADLSRWRFATASPQTVSRLTESLGIRAVRRGDGELIHPAGIVVLTPGGTISGYFFGVRFPAAELDRALARAAGEGIGTPLTRLAMLCFDYDPSTGRYTATVMTAVRLGGLLSVLTAVGLVGRTLLRERAGRRR